QKKTIVATTTTSTAPAPTRRSVYTSSGCGRAHRRERPAVEPDPTAIYAGASLAKPDTTDVEVHHREIRIPRDSLNPLSRRVHQILKAPHDVPAALPVRHLQLLVDRVPL